MTERIVIENWDYCHRCGKKIPDGAGRYVAVTADGSTIVYCVPCNGGMLNDELKQRKDT